MRRIRQVLFLHTAHQDERTFLLKDYEILQQVDPNSHDIQNNNILTEYQRRPKYLGKYCPVDFASQLRIVYPENVTLEIYMMRIQLNVKTQISKMQ